MTAWRCALALNRDREIAEGSPAALYRAIRAGADLRIGTDFYHHEHLEPGSANHELVREVSDFRVTYVIEERWVAGAMTLRLPISPPDGFGPRPSMSFFLYNQDGSQAIARPYLDGLPATGEFGPSPLDDHGDMPKYHQEDAWDSGTNAPSSNFVYEFEAYRFLVRDEWQGVLAHDANGAVVSGSLAALTEAFASGAEIKVAIRGLCADLGSAVDHEVLVQTGPGYHSTQRGLFCAGTHPVVRVKPASPLRYVSRGWDFGWLLVRTDGRVARWLCDPYTLQFRQSDGRYEVRWLVR